MSFVENPVQVLYVPWRIHGDGSERYSKLTPLGDFCQGENFELSR